MKWNWDYDLPDDWKPATDAEWEWFLVRKLNYGDTKGVTKTVIRKYFPAIKHRLDPGICALFENYFNHEADIITKARA